MFRAAHSQGQFVRRIKEDGYLAIKQKVGRPGQWMKGEAGVERDIERLLETMPDRGITISIAEGEGVQDFELFRPFLEAGIYDVVQPDLRTMGLTNILRGAALAE